MKKRAKTNYITNAETMAEIWKSKLSYCAAFEPIPQRVIDCEFDHDGEELVPEGLCRVFTYEHIPNNPKKTGGRRARPDKVEVNFAPFKIYLDGREIVRSHWRWDGVTGNFSTWEGRLTRDLGRQIEKMVDRISKKPNFAGYSYRDEMVATAALKCVEAALKFDDRRTANPFAYLTTIIINDFKRYLGTEKKHQTIRDDLLLSYGYEPSYSYADRKQEVYA